MFLAWFEVVPKCNANLRPVFRRDTRHLHGTCDISPQIAASGPPFL
jgi:hypothetical protein